MLKNQKYVSKLKSIIIVLMALMVILGVYIKVRHSAEEVIEINTIGIDSFEPRKSANTDEIVSVDKIAAIDLTTGTLIPEYKPIWTKVGSALDTTNKTLTVTFKGLASETRAIDSNVSINYQSDVASYLTIDHMQIFIDDVDVTSRFVNKVGAVDTTVPMKELKAGTSSTNAAGKVEITHQFVLYNFEEALRLSGNSYKELSGNVKIKILGRGEDPSTYNANVLTDKYGSSIVDGNVIVGQDGNQSMMESDQGQAEGTWVDITFSDTITNKNANGTMFADFVKPEFTYLSSETSLDRGNKVLTVVFSALDKYFDAANSSLALSDLSLVVDGQPVDVTAAGNTLTPAEITEDGVRIGTKYTLVIKNLQKNPSVEEDNENDAFSYSGIVSIGIPANKFKDYSSNGNDATTITVGVDDTDGNVQTAVDPTGTIIDVVDPVWKIENIDIDFDNDGVSFDLIAKDKYYLTNTLTDGMVSDLLASDKMLIYIDGELDGDTNSNGVLDAGETPTINKRLLSTTNLTPAGTGVKYTIKLENWNADKYSGTTKIKLPAGIITDQYTNTSVQQQFTIGHIDFIKPVIELVSKSKDPGAKTTTIVFKATDRYMNTTDLITIPDEDNPSAPDEITVYIDGEVATGITRTLTITSKIVRNTSTKAVTTQAANYTLGENEVLIGHEYTLVLSDLEQTRTTIDRTREYSDWSGTVQIEIKEGAVKDIQVTNPNGETAGGNLNDKTTLTGEFVDFIKPNVTYDYSASDIIRNHANKDARKFIMVFDVTDKYFTNSAFETALEAAATEEAKLAVLQEYLTIWVDTVNITNIATVTKKITSIEDVTATVNKTVGGIIQEDLANQVIGKRFTLEISNFEQELVALGDEYLNYSGVVSVAFNSGKPLATDTTGNVNNAGTLAAPTIMSGVDTPDGSGTGAVVDLVDPLWEVAGTVTARPIERTATIPIKGTDKYIQTNNLQKSDITITVTSPAGVVEFSAAEAESHGMTLSITPETINYGKKYTIQLDGYASDAYQVKVTLRDGILVDESGNTSQETSFILFSSLKETSTETDVDSGFLGNTNIERQKIEQVIFKDSLAGINSTRWDVTQLQDESIWGWYEETARGTYKVYIGSYIIINGNVNSSYLFANLGRDTNCAVTGDTTDNEMIENLYLLHVDGVQNMAHMFDGCGYAKMQSLDLGDYFDTIGATNMEAMFKDCGNTAMTSLDLGTKFKTTSVTTMKNMFSGCGQNAMTSFAMGATTNTIDFDTTLVTDMSGMFQNFGHKLANLTLGTNFKTNAVTDMSNMFNGTGKSSMTTLNLGSNFNTSAVQKMNGMFQDFATSSTGMTALDLGNLFYTTAATDMTDMFNGCGTAGMTTLDLGPAFTKIPTTNTGFVTNCGNSGTTIYAPESIYSNMKNFKLNASATTSAIHYTAGGVINPVYKPEWTKVSSNLNKSTGTMTVKINGASNKISAPVSQINYTSSVTPTMNSDQVTVYVDGQLASSISKSVSTVTTSTNATTGKTEAEYTITLTGFEETLRQAGKNFKEWSGNVALQLAKGTLTDEYGNQNLAVIDTTVDSSGTTTATKNIVVEEAAVLTANTDATEAQMFADVIKPEFTYQSSNTIIGNGNNGDTKIVTIVFDVTDKYYSATDLATDTNADLITVKVDNEEVNSTVNVTKTLTKTAIFVMNKETKVVSMKATDYTVPSTERLVGERYQLVLTGLEQNPNNAFDYSGIVTLGFGSGIVDDLSGNENDGTTITVGVEEPNVSGGANGFNSPSELYDATGLDSNKLQIGDFINYDAGTWTQEEIDAIGTANGSLEIVDVSNEGVKFSGFAAGSSRNGNTTLCNPAYDYIKDKSTNNAITGWRVFDIDGDNVTLISAGNPEAYFHEYGKVYESEYILSGNINLNWSAAEAENCETRNWGDYVNITQKATSATVLTESRLNSWYSKYMGVEDAHINNDNTFQQIYSEPYLKYQNIVDNYSEYILGTAYNATYLYTVNPDYRNAWNNDNWISASFNLRILVTLSPDVKLAKEGTKTLTGGNMDTYGGDQTYNVWNIQTTSSEGTIVDVVDPIWKSQNLTTTTTTNASGQTITTASVDLIATDKFFKESTLELNDIQLKVAGVDIAATDAEGNLTVAPELQKDLSDPTYITWDPDTETYVAATEETANAVKYTFTVSKLEESDSLFFAEREKYNDDDTTGRVYREYSGPTTIVVPADTIEDESGNKNQPYTVNVGTIDTIKPEVIKVSSTGNRNETNPELSTHTIVFDIVDKYLDTSSITTTDVSDIHVYIDGELTEIDTDGDGDVDTDTITKTITNIEQLNASVNGSTRKVGYRYTLVLSNFEYPRTSIDYTREYTDWSGVLTVKIDANTAYDENGLSNVETTLAGDEINTSTVANADFVDYIRPDATYEHSDSDVSEDVEDGKTYTMTFDITDKFFMTEDLNANGELDAGEDTNSNGVLDDGNNLSIADLQIKLSDEDTGDGSNYIDLTSNSKVGKSLRDEDITNTVNGSTVVIGKRYTLVIKNLEQVQKIEGNRYVDYSGSITVAIPAGKVTDTSGNGNAPTSITSGVNIPGGDVANTTPIDVVAPRWERIEFTTDIHAKTATIKLLGTDKYFYGIDDTTITTDDDYGILSSGEIKLFVNGEEATGNINISDPNKLYEERIVLPEYGDGSISAEPTTETVQYAVEYLITITDLTIEANQVKIRLTEGSLVDKSGNPSRTTEFLVYNTLRSTATETEATSTFLSEIVPDGRTAIQRQDIQQVIFVNSTTGSTAAGVQNVWDVSAQRDSSILAWYSEESAPYTVYIGSNDDIYGNVDSSYLFSYIGYGTSCTETEPVDELNLLRTENVTNMSYMFNNFGYRKLSTLSLGAFDTSNVTNMSNMFNNCGNLEMQSLNLGTKFDTSKVTDMSNMFNGCGQTLMESINFGTDFDTSAVTNMSGMFQNCGQSKLASLDLGATGVTFDTSAVTDMSNMFSGCGQSEMLTFNLGSQFDTSAVTNMSGMFQNFGYKIETLNLGGNFYTSAVTDMSDMFNGCGQTLMKTLTLGDNFNTSAVQDMSNMFKDFAKSSTAITTLDLREKFYTTSATDMTSMFENCGLTAMTTIDLGPAFTKIAGTNTNFVTSTGKSGCIIYAPEAIYNDMTHLRLGTDSTTTIQYTVGKINPKYKPEWSKISSSITINDETLENSTMTIKVKGNVDATVYENAIKTITSGVTAGNDSANLIRVFVDGEAAEDITQTVVVDSVTDTEVQYTITLSNFQKSIRKSGKNFREWAGNVALQFVRGSLLDAYGNKNMTQIDVDPDGDGTTEIQQIKLQDDPALSANDTTNNDKMFGDFIRPEFTYEYYNATVDTNANTVIDYTNNKVTIVFDVTDKYFASTTLSTDTTGSNITVKVDEDADANTAITKALGKKVIAADQVVGDITYKANGDIYYTVNGTSKKIGERYELVITGLESSLGVGYSGPMTLAFPAGTITDESGNTSIATTITIGIDTPNSEEDETKHPEHNTSQVVDVINPIWSYADSDIDRTNNQVNIYIIGSDKYYSGNTLTKDNITVYVDGTATTVDTDRDGTADAAVTNITKNLTDITDTIDDTRRAELIAGAGLTSLMTADNNMTDVGVIYKLTLGNFGTISGETKVVLPKGTIEDTSGNKNGLMSTSATAADEVINGNTTIKGRNSTIEGNSEDTIIEVGNLTWTETGDNSTTPRYPAFRENIVDFIVPTINYTYSRVEGEENPDIDYEQKTVTLKFTVTDKYLLESDLIKTVTNEDGTTTQLPKNITISVDGTEVYNANSETQTTQVTTSISVAEIANGKEYTLVVSNVQQDPNNAFDFSGPMQVAFAAGVIDDTSGNKNAATVIALDTEIGSDIVDVVDPIIYYNGSSINRGANTVTLYLKAEDKYIASQTLADAESTVKVKVIEADGTITHVDGTISFENGSITHTDKGVVSSSTGKVLVNDTTTITKAIDLYEVQTYGYIFQVTLSNFGIYEGITSVIIPKDVIKDTSGNGNIETEILVGRAADTTAFKDSLVDFTKPTWNYVTSTINRDWDDTTDRRLQNGEGADGTVTLEIKGTDTYFDDSYFTDSSKELDLSAVKVYVNNVLNNTITKTFAPGTYKEYINDELDANGRLLEGVKYTIVLGNFQANEGTVKIEVPANAIKDTSTNGNDLKFIDVGNEAWVEEDDDPNDPKYTAFRTDIVDFIKPVITYQYGEGTNPVIDRTNSSIAISFNVTDTNFLESNIQFNETQKDIQVFVDVDDNEKNVTNILDGTLTSVDYVNGTVSGKTYTLTLSGFEQDALLASEVFLRHSGVIKLVIAEDTVWDTSGNPNNKTTLIIDQGDGDGGLNGTLDLGEDLNGNDQLDSGEDEKGVIVDFIKPIVYYNSKYINWEDRYAEVTIRATDRFYDTSTTLDPTDITLYQQNDAGDYVQINDFTGKIEISRTKLQDVDGNIVGYDYKIKLKDFEEEFKLRISVPANKLGDTSGNYNEQKNIDVALDNKRPTWEYVSADTTNFVSSGEITFNVKGVDKFLDLTRSGLADTDLRVIKDGVDITNKVGITVNYDADNSSNTEKSKAYGIVVTGLTEAGLGQSPVGTYSLVFAPGKLYDEFGNVNAATTISFSQAVITSNTGNYVNVTYHVSSDLETVHKSYIHELMSVNTTGTNFENRTYRPSTLGELFNNGENPLFAEPTLVPAYEDDGYTVRHDYSPKSFAGWAEADAKGNPIYYTNASLTTVSSTKTAYTRVFGLYDEIDKDITHLKAVWQDAKVIFVKSTGSTSNSGTKATEPVPDLATAFSKLDTSGTSTSNVIVIMDAIEWDDDTTLTGNTTITSLYAGIDYSETQNAELMISSNMVVEGDIIFDNIKLYAESTTVSNGTNYLGNGNYTNMLISNYSGDITIGRGVTTPTDNYTFGAIIGGNYKNETSTGNLGTHTIRVEAGKYNNIIAGSTLASSTTTSKFASYEVVIGNMKDAAISRNNKLTITGYVAMGENEKACYPAGSTVADDAFDKTYANVTLYSGTFTGANKFAKATENAAIYMRSINGQSDGILNFEMYGGAVTGNVYAGARSESIYPTNVYNTLNFYGGQVTGNIFGQGATDTFKASSTIILQGCFSMTGNVFGGSNATTEGSGTGIGNTNITINSSSVTVDGDIYGGSKGISNSGYITGTTTITLRAGTVGNIYGSGNNSGNSGATTITMENGNVSGDIVGGAYNEQGGTTAAITVLGGTVSGNIYGGNKNIAQSNLDNDTRAQDITITIGDTDPTIKPTITGNIYGSGNFDKVDVVDIYLNEAENVTSVYGGATANSTTAKVNIYLNGMTVNEIYGGGQNAGTVTTANIFLQSGTATDVYGGGYKANVTTANIKLEGSEVEIDADGDGTPDSVEVTPTIGTIYGGPSSSGTVGTANVTLTSGELTNVYGGGNSANVTTANVELNGITIESIHGGSRNSGTTTNANVKITTGTVATVFGGGFGGETINSKITFDAAGEADVTNVYGGNDTLGITMNSVINIQGTTTIKGKLYGGGYNSAIGKVDEPGTTTINISGGTIEGDINGGSEHSIVYGNTNINIGQDATGTSLTAGDIEINGTIYGAGDSAYTDYSTVSVHGDTYIKMDNSEASPITFSGSIYGAGKGATYLNTDATDTEDGSTIQILDLGTATDAHELTSIERTGRVYIGNSYIELFGKQDANNASPLTSYTLNRITHALTIYNNTTLYTRRGFNMVGGFNSYRTVNLSTGTGTKATVSIDGNVATTNVDNRLYTLEGVNLIFAKQEGDIYRLANAEENIWGEVNGMTFFGMYRINRTSNQKEFDLYDANIYDEDFTGEIVEDFFANGTFVEAQHEPSHSISLDGFYTNVADYTDPDNITVVPEVIDVIDGGNYYDWIVGAEVVTYNEMLIASASGRQSMAEITLDYNYLPNATYTFDRVSLNALNTNVNLINPLNIAPISENANNTFGLIMRTADSGWLNSAKTTIYTQDYGSFTGDTLYKTDESSQPGALKFAIYSSTDITEQIDLGKVNLRLIGRTPASADGTRPANTFIIIISLDLKTIVEDVEEEEDAEVVEGLAYIPRFTNSVDQELHYTSDSKVDITYTLYNPLSKTIYSSGMYRVLTTTTPFPAGTRITLNDKAQGKVYYYHVIGTETEYRLSNFLVMDSTNDHYVDSGVYYNSIEGYVFERYEVSIDFLDAGINADLAQETYLELRLSDGTVRYDNGENQLTYNLHSGEAAKAVITQTITNQGQIYSVVDDLEILFTLNASIQEKKTADGKTIMDTKYYDKTSGLALEILDSTLDRVKSPAAQNIAIINVDDPTEEYVPDEGGVIRIPLMETISSVTKNYKMTISQNDVDTGKCSVNLYFFASDDGRHMGGEQYVEREFYLMFVNSSVGIVGIEATENSRIINKSTGLNLEGNSGIDMTITIGSPVDGTNVRMELYKRNATYTDIEDETTYTGTTYTLVNLEDYLDGTWQTPEEADPPTVDEQGEVIDEGLITDGSYQYILLSRQTYPGGEGDDVVINLEKAIKSTVGTGEYKLVLKTYHDNILTQTVRKTFVVTP